MVVPRKSGVPVSKDFGLYLRDKDVVLVGPSDGYAGSGMGPEIDAADVVVRMNWGCPVPGAQQADLGSRTDVLYKRMLNGALPDAAEVDGWVRDGVRWVITSDQNEGTRHYTQFAPLVQGRFEVGLLGTTRQVVLSQMRNSPLMGLLAVTHLLAHPLRSLTVRNCDFYAGGYHAGYGGEEYRKARGRTDGQAGPTHDVDVQLRYLGRLRYLDRRLKFDEALDALVQRAEGSELMKGVVAVIPARYGSGRFPGKPLALIHGKPMVVRVCERVAEVVDVVVATDDERIRAVVEEHGYRAVMTGDAATGTDRVAQAVRKMKRRDLEIVVNVQGDEPLVDPRDIVALVGAKRAKPHAVINGMCPLVGDPYDATVVKAVAARNGRLIYASRAPVPATKDGGAAEWKQLGLYAFSPKELEAYALAGRGAIEATEDVEILRFLEQAMPVQMVELRGTPQAVDLPEHVAVVEEYLKALTPGPSPASGRGERMEVRA